MLAVYGAGLLVASPVFGYIADHTKYRRSPFLWGLILLAASTALFCVGNSMVVLIIARLVQGMSGGCIWVVGLALVIDTVPANEQAQSMGFVAIGLTAGSSLGPLLGGVIYERAGYVAVFILGFAVIGVDVIMRLLVIEKAEARQWQVEDPPSDPAVASSSSSSKAQTNPPPVQTARDVILANPAPAGKESRIPAIILLLQSPRQLNSLLITVMLGSIFSAFDAVLPLRVVHLFNFNPTAAGLVFLSIIIPSLVAPLGGRFSDRYGPRWFVVVLLCALLSGIGFLVSAAMPGAMGEISASVVEYERQRPGVFGERGAFAQAYALFNVAYSVGSVVGPLLGGFLNDAVGWNNLMLTFGVMCFATSMVTVWYTGGKITKDDLPWRWRRRAPAGTSGDLDVESKGAAGSTDIEVAPAAPGDVDAIEPAGKS
ncbi:hypothetical protein DRE_07561 [Drechslerella stenobrocha 248]|uniref:Major facilitator superfamily (MFS) profile domain-containing protein n=1 Tax=Drechslerella stenobrocha 248 TaxID=1043628 RepID=W7HHV3_9PEZI|nr:hypothetical protein DRE_07561 [Drechslerella stenobrocha 248]